MKSQTTNGIKNDKSLLSFLNCAYYTFFDYSLFLSRFQIKLKNGGKYFKQCFKWRPLNQYLHYQFSLYLYNVLKKEKDAWHHLKLAVNGHQKTQQSRLNSLYYQLLVNKHNGNSSIDVDKLNQFLKFCKCLFNEHGKNPTCDDNKCSNRIIRTKQCPSASKHTCQGCKENVL